MNKIIVHHRSSHHAANSGYGRVIDYINAEVIYGQVRFPYRLAKFFANRHYQNAGIYDSNSVLKSIELYQALRKYKGQNNIVHFLNGERDVRHLGFFKKRFPNTIFCATFHKPPEILKKSITNNSALQKLDGAIAVGVNQVEFLKDWLGLEKVRYIPHGVDTDFFKPDPRVKKENTLLFVGQHLRDFEMFNKTIPKIAEMIIDLKVNIVLHPSYVSKIEQHPNMEIFTSVDDERLLKLYQEATALYLPMLNSTACNSILEAMACGLPIITSNVGGNMTYLETTSNIIIENADKDDFIRETISLLRNNDQLESIGNTSRNRAESLNWERVALKINNLYTLIS